MRRILQLMHLAILFLASSAHGQTCGYPPCDMHPASADTISLQSLHRPVTGVYSLEVGRRSVVSRYLAPVSYAGAEFALSGTWSKVMPFAPRNAMMELHARVNGSLSLLNPRKNTSMQGIDAEFVWNMRYRLPLAGGFLLTAGGGPEIEAGALALLKNSNNPVSVNVAAALSAAASMSWTHWFGRLPVVACLDLRIPLVGAFYMPGYGETYFEMYVGNHSGLIHFGWPGNRTKIAAHLSLKLDFGRTAMEVGYRFGWQRAEACHLVYRNMSNAFTIGVIPSGLGLKRHTPQILPF